MFQIYFCIGAVIFSIAFSVGLMSGIYFRPPETHSDQEIYKFAGEVVIVVSLLIAGIMALVMKKLNIKISKNLVENKEDRDEKKK